MKKISTKNLKLLPTGREFQNLCKSISALEAIICPEWNYRYFSYDMNWSRLEEVCEMRDGEGNHMLILFSDSGVVINGFAEESNMNGWRFKSINENESFFKRLFRLKKVKEELVQEIRKGVTDQLPKEFEKFIFGEPVKSIGTTFCIWQKPFGSNWQIGNIQFSDNECLNDGSAELLNLLDGYPLTYKKWADVYYEGQFGRPEIDLKTVQEIYQQHKITLSMVKKINPTLEDFEKLRSDLERIGYENEI